MKFFSRFSLLNLLAIYIVSRFYPFKFSKPVSEVLPMEWALFGWTLIAFLCILVWWIYLFYHWGVSSFNNRGTKRVWFVVLLLGALFNFLGPIIYYIAVIEMKKTIKVSD